MRRRVIAAQLLRVDHSLSLTRTLDSALNEPQRFGDSTPGVLIIPRGGNPREPHLITLEIPYGPCDGQAPASCVMTDPHTVVCIERAGDGDLSGRQAADVVVHSGLDGCPDSSDRAKAVSYPPRHDLDCDITASNLESWCLFRFRDSMIVEIRGPAALLARAAPSWLAVYGSVLHCWLAAGMPIGMLADAAVAAGHYFIGSASGDYRFSVAGRAHVFVTSAQ